MEVNNDDALFLKYGQGMTTTTTTTTHHNTRYSPSKQSNNNNNLVEDENDYYELPTEEQLLREIQEEELEYTTLLTLFREEQQQARGGEEIGLEITKLIEERDMDIDILLRRLMEEGELEQQQQQLVDMDLIKGKPYFRAVQMGDSISISGMKGSKKVLQILKEGST